MLLQAHLGPDWVLRAAVAADGPLMLHRGVHALHARQLPLVFCRHSHPFQLCGIRFMRGKAHTVQAIMLCRQTKPQVSSCGGAASPRILHIFLQPAPSLLHCCWAAGSPGGKERVIQRSHPFAFLAATQMLLSCERQAGKQGTFRCQLSRHAVCICMDGPACLQHTFNSQHTDHAEPCSPPGMCCMAMGAPGGCSAVLRRSGRPRCCRSAATLGSSTGCRGCHCIGW